MGSSPRRRGSSVVARLDLDAVGVLPAQAGVFQVPDLPQQPPIGPPRAGGGLPLGVERMAHRRASSPRRRGSSPGLHLVQLRPLVLPAQAGVFRPPRTSASVWPRPPRAGGGLPPSANSSAVCGRSSPRRRGSSAAWTCRSGHPRVLPAQAGVFLSEVWTITSGPCPPRAGGGLPRWMRWTAWIRSSSPRRRGSSRCHPRVPLRPPVLPAQAGVFPGPRPCCGHGTRPPRAGGGLPFGLGKSIMQLESSPRRRGSSGGWIRLGRDVRVLPAQAGVFPGSSRSRPGRGCPPRAGGGLPQPSPAVAKLIASSPRRRGSSLDPNLTAHRRRVLPAQAGVFRS